MSVRAWVFLFLTATGLLSPAATNRIISLPEATSLSGSESFVFDSSTTGTKRVTLDLLANEVAPKGANVFTSARRAGLSNLWTIGDSHTVGQLNIAGTSNWLSGGFMVTNFRYPNILASRHSLLLTNLAVSGSAISQGDPGASGPDLSSTLWQLSQIGPTWRGIVTILHGYNDGYNQQDIASVLTWMESAQAASIATAFATNWVGPSGTNWFGAAVAGWTNGGTLFDEGQAGKALFPVSGGLGGNRTSVRLAPGQAWSATLSGRVGLILERWQYGGVVSITTNGGYVAQQVLDTRGNGYASTPRRLPVLHLLDLPSSTTVTVTSLTQTNTLLGVVWVGAESDVSARRLIVSSGTPLGDNAIRSDGMIAGIGAALFRAAARWKDYPVWTTMAGAAIDPRSDVYSTDLSHPGPSGHIKLADGFEAATEASAAGPQVSRLSIDLPHVRSSGAMQVFGGGAVGQDYSRPSASVSFAGGYGAFLDANGGGLGLLTNLYLRGNNISLQYGGLSVLSASSLGAVPRVPAIHLSYGGGAGYLDAHDYGDSTWKPLYYRSRNHRFEQGSLVVTASTLDTNDTPSAPGAHLSVVGDEAYLDSINLGTNGVWTDMNYRARVHKFANGPVSVSASYLTTNDPPMVGAVHLSFGGGQGYLDAWDYGQASANQPKPLNLRGQYVSVPYGPLLITSGAGSGIPTNGALMLFQDGSTAQIRGSRESGYMPVALDGSSAKMLIAGLPRLSVSNNVVQVETNLVVRGSIELGGVAYSTWPTGGGTGDVSAAGANVFTGLNVFTNLLTTRGGLEVSNYYLRVMGPSAGGRIFPSTGEGMEILYDATNWVDSTGSSGRGEIQVYDRGGSSYGDFRFNARNSGFYGSGTLVLLVTNGQAQVTGNLFVNSTNVMDAIAGKQASDSDLTELASTGTTGSGHFVRSNAPTMRDPTFLGSSTFSSMTVTTLTATTISGSLSAPTINDGVTYEQATLAAHSAGTNYVVDPTLAQYQRIAVSATNAVRFLHLTNAAAGRQTVVLVDAGTNATVTVALGANQFASTTNLVTLTAGQILPISFYCYGSVNTQVLASVPTLPFVFR